MSEYAIEVTNLRKRFCRSLKRSLIYGTTDVARAMAGFPDQEPKIRPGEFWALDGISFKLKRGESLGLIGANGCGKSTLLRLLTGIFPPDYGDIKIRGRIASLIAVGAGFHPHMSGAENIFLNGVLLGLSRQEIKAAFNDIVDFAEIGDFIDAPVSTYSSGMRVRLGFAIAINTRPDILLVDEVMSVGDTRFRRKASAAMERLLSKDGTTVILVSHNSDTVRAVCSKSLMIDHGRQVFFGDTDEAFGVYEEMGANSDLGRANSDFQSFRLFSEAGENEILAHQDFFVQLQLREELQDGRQLPVSVAFLDQNLTVIAAWHTDAEVKNEGSLCLKCQGIPIKQGKYLVNVKIGNQFQGASTIRNHSIKAIGTTKRSSASLCYELEIVTDPFPLSATRTS